MRHAFAPFILQRLSQRKVSSLVAVRPDVIRPIKVLGRYLRWRDELADLDFTRSFRLEFLQFFFVKNHKGTRLNLKAFLNLVAGNLFAVVGLDHVLLDSRL